MRKFAWIIGAAALILAGLFTSGVLRGSEENAAGIETAASPKTQRTERIRAQAETWPKEPNYFATFNPLDPAGSGASPGAPETRAKFDPNDDYWGLPRTPGFELVDAYCSACHTLEIVMQQAATPERWTYMLDWMVREQGMAPMPQDDRASVLAYLTSNFGAETH